ncbi:MAG: methyltransferase family protein [Anaerolineae bacterium]
MATALLIYVGYLLWIPLPAGASPALSLALRLAGLVLFLGGLLLLLWPRRTLGALWGFSTSFGTQLRAQHQLITHGPFAFIRHPMYSGLWLMLAGAVLAYHTWGSLAYLVGFVVSLRRRAQLEDKVLEARFGAEWRDYAARVPRFVPWLGQARNP